MISGLLMVLVPLLLGYLLKIKNKSYITKINQIVMFLLYIILFLMGYLLGQLDNLEKVLPVIGKTAVILSVTILSINIGGLMLYDRLNPAPPLKTQGKIGSRWHAFQDSFKLFCAVVIGALLGWLLKSHFTLSGGMNLYVLIALIFFVGIQLRNNGIALKEALFNKRGFQTAIIFTLTSLLGGMIAAFILSIPITQGLAFASGMGWYSLSSVVLTNAWGPVQGSIAFFNDLLREMVSLFIVPFFMQHFRSTAIGITGATALDCTLPIIQKSGGIEVVPIAISFGFVTNILPPLLLVLFSGIPL
ncbi:hypothetical protein BKL49_04740 [Rodentibacter myodis]|uniref:Lysine exporter LysO family protein n=2 Tax=Rodentibacter myodis TaxID=1907939 RepID=A0A1V3JSY4_9PAST|nr:hypothetical protein BKL49_04740 [Rodentibacter myodis]